MVNKYPTLDKWRVRSIEPRDQGEKPIFHLTQAIGSRAFADKMVDYYINLGHIDVKVIKGTWWRQEQLELPFNDAEDVEEKYVPNPDTSPLGD